MGPVPQRAQWGTVREDYSEAGTAWEYLPHDHARSRAYRWGEDGIAGISDDSNGSASRSLSGTAAIAILKERLFGLTSNEGNHGEDVKERYYYLDATPTHSYMQDAVQVSASGVPVSAGWSRKTAGGQATDPEFELMDTACSMTTATSTSSSNMPRQRPKTS